MRSVFNLRDVTIMPASGGQSRARAMAACAAPNRDAGTAGSSAAAAHRPAAASPPCRRRPDQGGRTPSAQAGGTSQTNVPQGPRTAGARLAPPRFPARPRYRSAAPQILGSANHAHPPAVTGSH